MHIEMGDDGRYSTTDISIVSFKRESGSSLTLKYVMYVLGLKKNLVLVSMLGNHAMMRNLAKERISFAT